MALSLPQQTKAAGEVPTEEKLILLLTQAAVARNNHKTGLRYQYLDHVQEMLLRLMEQCPEWRPPAVDQSSPVSFG